MYLPLVPSNQTELLHPSVKGLENSQNMTVLKELHIYMLVILIIVDFNIAYQLTNFIIIFNIYKMK